METKIELIDSNKARLLLERNKVNRNLKPAIVREYARQMRRGLWRENTGESIKISINDELLDGQHRLYAVIEVDITLSFLVVRDLEEDIFPVIDTGSKRTPGDSLHISGVSNANSLAAGIKKYKYLKSGFRSKGSSFKMSNQEVLDEYFLRKDFYNEFSSIVGNWYRISGRLLSPSDFLGYFAFFYDINEEKALIFISSLADGKNLSQYHPVNLLRHKLFLARMNPKFSLLQTVKTAYIIIAWNIFRKEREVKTLSYYPTKNKYPIAH